MRANRKSWDGTRLRLYPCTNRSSGRLRKRILYAYGREDRGDRRGGHFNVIGRGRGREGRGGRGRGGYGQSFFEGDSSVY